MGREFEQALAQADKKAQQFLNQVKQNPKAFILFDDDEIYEDNYQNAVDLAKPNTEEKRDAYLHLIDYLLARHLLFLPYLKEYLTRKGTTIGMDTLFGDFTQVIDWAIEDCGIYRDTFIAKKNEVFAKYQAAYDKYGINTTNNKASNAVDNKKSGCYIATAVYGSYDCPEVLILRNYRDIKLKASRLGRIFVNTYYKISPTLVRLFGKKEWFINLGREYLDKFVMKLQSKGF